MELLGPTCPSSPFRRPRRKPMWITVDPPRQNNDVPPSAAPHSACIDSNTPAKSNCMTTEPHTPLVPEIRVRWPSIALYSRPPPSLQFYFQKCPCRNPATTFCLIQLPQDTQVGLHALCSVWRSCEPGCGTEALSQSCGKLKEVKKTSATERASKARPNSLQLTRG